MRVGGAASATSRALIMPRIARLGQIAAKTHVAMQKIDRGRARPGRSPELDF